MRVSLFNNKMPAVNEEWGARVLGMSYNPGRGVDLFDDKKVVEVKTHMPTRPPKKKRTAQWKVADHQMNYGKREGLPLYFLNVEYKMDRHVEDVPEDIPYFYLEKMVLEREAWVVTRDWMSQFVTYRQNGETEKSKWENFLKFSYKKYLPRTYKTFEVEKGKLHLTAGVERGLFLI